MVARGASRAARARGGCGRRRLVVLAATLPLERDDPGYFAGEVRALLEAEGLQLLFDDRVTVELVDDALDPQVFVAAHDGEPTVVRAKAVVLHQRQFDVDVAMRVAALAQEVEQLVRRRISVDLDGLVRGAEQVLVPLAIVGGQECVGSDRRRGSAATAIDAAAPNFSTTT